jgi:hypothetical protein
MNRSFPLLNEEQRGRRERIDLPFTFGDIPQLLESDIRNYLEIYFYDRAKGITDIEVPRRDYSTNWRIMYHF